MNEKIVMGVLLGIFVFSLVGSVEAYRYDRGKSNFYYSDYNPYSNRVYICASFGNDCGYRKYKDYSYSKNWVLNSYDARYDYAFGKPSGIVFSNSEYEGKRDYSAWRFKQAYDYRYEIGNNYYAPRYNHKGNYWDWRY